MVSNRARGFIFVEKTGEADDIKSLSNHGWAIVVGQGFSTRLMRKLLKDDKRPVLVLHDADISGEWIYKIFDIGSKRTKHLELWLDDVVDLGLNLDDSRKLDLPPQQEAKKYRDKQAERVELSAFTLLKKRFNMVNPVLAYTIARMKQKGVRITPTPLELQTILRFRLKIRIELLLDAISGKLQKMIDEIPEYADRIAYSDDIQYPSGIAVQADVGDASDRWQSYDVEQSELFSSLQKAIAEELNKIRPWLIEESQSMVNNATSVDVDEYEQRVVDESEAQWILDKLNDN
jgi:5S rRNA maturation endonuclease (ribonuclease M5)